MNSKPSGTSSTSKDSIEAVISGDASTIQPAVGGAAELALRLDKVELLIEELGKRNQLVENFADYVSNLKGDLVARRDRQAISSIYKEAKRLTRETGIAHHVDHIYPIKGALCCGLHVHQNLRVLQAVENIAKSNTHPLDESPALEGMSDLEIRLFIDSMFAPRPA